MKNEIRTAVETLKPAYIRNAIEQFVESAKRTHELLAETNFCKEHYIGEYSSSKGRKYYIERERKEAWFNLLTVGYYKQNDPNCIYDTTWTYRAKTEAELQDLIRETVKTNAELKFEGYVLKLIGKVGEVKSATCRTLCGSTDVWIESVLTVEKNDGEIENWKTRIIWNHSIYGLPFNQFPTRKMKA